MFFVTGLEAAAAAAHKQISEHVTHGQLLELLRMLQALGIVQVGTPQASIVTALPPQPSPVAPTTPPPEAAVQTTPAPAAPPPQAVVQPQPSPAPVQEVASQ